MVSQFEDLQACYLSLRRSGSASSSAAAPRAPNGAAGEERGAASPDGTQQNQQQEQQAPGQEIALRANGHPGSQELASKGEQRLGPVLAGDGFAEFSRMLSVFTHCSKLKARAWHNPADDLPADPPGGSALVINHIDHRLSVVGVSPLLPLLLLNMHARACGSPAQHQPTAPIHFEKGV